MAHPPKTAHLQIRVSRQQKAELVRRARAAGLDLSSFVLERVAPRTAGRFAALVRSLANTPLDPFVLAEIADLLTSLRPDALHEAVADLPRSKLDGTSANLLAAMVETRSAKLGVRPPEWTTEIEPLETPWFATDLSSLRLYLLCNSPPAFRRRNLFVDSTLGDRV